MTERIRKVFIYERYGQSGGMKELKFGGALPCISRVIYSCILTRVLLCKRKKKL